jgi:hypothetical protein
MCEPKGEKLSFIPIGSMITLLTFEIVSATQTLQKTVANRKRHCVFFTKEGILYFRRECSLERSPNKKTNNNEQNQPLAQ